MYRITIILYSLKISIINSGIHNLLRHSNSIPKAIACILLATAAISIGSCRHEETVAQPLFTLLTDSGINFQNTVTDSKSDNSFYFRNFYNGGGVAIADINNDGLADVLLTSNMGENKLFLNKGNLQFEDISVACGLKQDSMWSTGAVMADVNNDGWLDIYICSSGHINSGRRINKLYINNRNGSFTERGKEYGLDQSGYCTQASFFDYDMDGDLDCLLINNSPLPFSSLNYATMRDTEISKWKVNDNLKGGGNHLLKNENGHFREVTIEAGLHGGLISFGLGVSVGDINNDNYPDIYVGNDFIEKDYLYINQKDGTFRDELEEHIGQISMSSMSSDLGDINNDGYPEIFTTDMIPDDDYRLKTTGTYDNIDLYLSKQKAGLYHQYVKNSLQLNNRDGSFSEIANYSGVAGTDWSWGALFLDADNDGLNDLFVCNGINRDVGDLDFLDFFSNDFYQQMLATGKKTEVNELLSHIPVTPLANRVFKNEGNLRFSGREKAWGLDKLSFSNSVAYGDLDNDGDLDLVVNNENEPAFVYRNNSRQQTTNSYLGIVLQGKDNNRFAVGSKIKVYAPGAIFYREVVPSRGFQSAVDYKQLIGLGQLKAVDSLVITWPNRTQTTILHPAINQVHTINQPVTAGVVTANTMVTSTLLQQLPTHLDKHTEDEYLDFYYERNLPELLSTEGPKIAVGDVNGDGLEDMYLGGAKGQAGQLYLQSATGFTKKEEPVFNEFAGFEDVAVLFFDADKDGDLDLYIGPGGNNAESGSREIQHRLYKNDGKGNFQIDAGAFPNNAMNISVAIPYDYDNDGDEDLFIGARSVPYNYGLVPTSYLFANDGKGHFTDVTFDQAPAFSTAGMITAAAWADLDGDNRKELVITGEWMTTRIFSFDGATRKMKEHTATRLEKMNGWWQSIAVADINGDGRPDLVIGNIGNNFYLHPDNEHPVRLWLDDFDQNGTPEQFITKTIDGKDMPVFLKREITEQFPVLKKQNLKHKDYASKTIEELFSKEVLKDASTREFNYTSSITAINDGKGHFTIAPLPLQCQLSGINAILITDVNGDQRPDMIIGGNLFNFPPQFGRLDASYGGVLLNTGKTGLQWVGATASGLSIRGQVKDIKEINRKEGRSLIFARNNEQPLLYTIKKP